MHRVAVKIQLGLAPPRKRCPTLGIVQCHFHTIVPARALLLMVLNFNRHSLEYPISTWFYSLLSLNEVARILSGPQHVRPRHLGLVELRKLLSEYLFLAFGQPVPQIIGDVRHIQTFADQQLSKLDSRQCAGFAPRPGRHSDVRLAKTNGGKYGMRRECGSRQKDEARRERPRHCPSATVQVRHELPLATPAIAILSSTPSLPLSNL